MAKERYLEADIKSSAINYMINNDLISKEDVIINEFIIGNYDRRVDLAIIKSQKLHAYEIKSEADNLNRLEGQVIKYLQFFDKVTVIAAPKHASKVLQMTPSHVAVWEIHNERIKILRRGKTIHISDKIRLLKFMNVSELAQIARHEKLIFQSTRRRSLENGLIYLPVHKLREYTIKFLQKRYRSTTDLFFDEIKKVNFVSSDNLFLLRVNRTNPISNDTTENINSFLKILKELDIESNCPLSNY